MLISFSLWSCILLASGAGILHAQEHAEVYNARAVVVNGTLVVFVKNSAIANTTIQQVDQVISQAHSRTIFVRPTNSSAISINADEENRQSSEEPAANNETITGNQETANITVEEDENVVGSDTNIAVSNDNLESSQDEEPVDVESGEDSTVTVRADVEATTVKQMETTSANASSEFTMTSLHTVPITSTVEADSTEQSTTIQPPESTQPNTDTEENEALKAIAQLIDNFIGPLQNAENSGRTNIDPMSLTASDSQAFPSSSATLLPPLLGTSVLQRGKQRLRHTLVALVEIAGAALRRIDRLDGVADPLLSLINRTSLLPPSSSVTPVTSTSTTSTSTATSTTLATTTEPDILASGVAAISALAGTEEPRDCVFWVETGDCECRQHQCTHWNRYVQRTCQNRCKQAATSTDARAMQLSTLRACRQLSWQVANSCGRPGSYSPHPRHCGCYFHCDTSGQRRLLACSAGLHFDQRYGTDNCVQPLNAGCPLTDDAGYGDY